MFLFLSEQITEIDPIVSQILFVINAFIFAIFCIVIARVILIIVGSPSGTAATTRATQTTRHFSLVLIELKNGIIPELSIIVNFLNKHL